MATPEWMERLKRVGLAGVASALAISPRGKDSYAPCPACNADRRASDDRRGPVTVGDRDGWECHACKARGDAVDMLAHRVCGKRWREASPEEKAATREHAERLGLVDSDDGPGRRVVPRQAAVMAPRQAARTVVRRSARATTSTVEEAGDGSHHDPGGRVRGSDFAWSDSLADEAISRLWDDPEAQPTRDYLLLGRAALSGGADGRRLPEAAIRKWKLGAWRHPDGSWWVSIPLLDPRSREVVNVKFRRVPLADGTCPRPKYMACPGRPLTLFGVGALPDDLGAPVVICEGELDVVAFWAFGWERGVVSGTSGAGSWKEEWLDALEPYEHFVVAYDADAAGEEGKGKAKVIELLGKDRCAVATLPAKDAGECWLDRVDPDEFARAVDRAEPLAGMKFVGAGDAVDEYERRAARGDNRIKGYPTFCAPLDALFGGWACGLNVVTGFPGKGKTSFATWALVEQARRGVPSVLTSFEQGRLGSVAKVLRQFLGSSWEDADAAQRAKARAEIAKLPLIFADRDGKARLDELEWSIRYSVRRQGARVWMVDHLGYLIDHGSKVSEVTQIDEITNTLANLGKELGIAILLLAHVTKVKDRYWHGKEERAHLGQLRGSSSIEGECALGLVVEPVQIGEEKGKPGTGWPGVEVHCDKARTEYGAGSGQSARLFFDTVACCYSDRWEQLPSNWGRTLPATEGAQPDTAPARTTRTARTARDPSPQTTGGTT